ncbi:MAG: aminoacyl-tRNA hydrolase [Bacteroidetes bacterium]|nr:aminoacyl-tRNA hydrolase [Bacteroidota bacterium]
MSKFLIIGLGNIGLEFENTRHNIGFDVATAFVQKHGGNFIPGRFVNVSEIKWKGKTFIVIKPTTYMNLSGKAFSFWVQKEKIKLENSLTIVDDLALPLSKLRLRASGSDAGHNGLKDIQFFMNTDAYPKLRFGIGNHFPKGRQADFVLSKWLPSELPIIEKKIEASIKVIEDFSTIGISATMNWVNKMEFL